MSKILSYVLSIVGVLILALSVKPVNAAIAGMIPIISSVPSYIFIGAGLILIILGVLFMRSSGGPKQAPEVPIYQGKNVVGFRRMGKK